MVADKWYRVRIWTQNLVPKYRRSISEGTSVGLKGKFDSNLYSHILLTFIQILLHVLVQKVIVYFKAILTGPTDITNLFVASTISPPLIKHGVYILYLHRIYQRKNVKL